MSDERKKSQLNLFDPTITIRNKAVDDQLQVYLPAPVSLLAQLASAVWLAFYVLCLVKSDWLRRLPCDISYCLMEALWVTEFLCSVSMLEACDRCFNGPSVSG